MSVYEMADAMEAEALKAALQAGAMAPCRWHKDETIRLGDPDAEKRAFAVATNRWKKGSVPCERDEFMDILQNVLHMADEECPRCEDDAHA